MSGLEVTRRDGTVTVVLDGARSNALDAERYAGLRSAAESVGAGEVLVVRAEGRHFCAGQDLDAHAAAAAAGRAAAALREGAAAILAVLRCQGPVVVAAQGAAIGGGALLAAAADVLVLADDAWLRLPELELGMPLGAAVASRLLPEPLVRRMLLTGARVGADEVARHGGALVVPREELRQEADRTVSALQALDRDAVLVARELWGGDERERAALAYEREVAASVGLLIAGEPVPPSRDRG